MTLLDRLPNQGSLRFFQSVVFKIFDEGNSCHFLKNHIQIINQHQFLTKTLIRQSFYNLQMIFKMTYMMLLMYKICYPYIRQTKICKNILYLIIANLIPKFDCVKTKSSKVHSVEVLL